MNELSLIVVSIVGVSIILASTWIWGYIVGRSDEREDRLIK